MDFNYEDYIPTLLRYIVKSDIYDNAKMTTYYMEFIYSFDSVFNVLNRYIKTKSCNFKVIRVNITNKSLYFSVFFTDTNVRKSIEVDLDYLLKLYKTLNGGMSDFDKTKVYEILSQYYLFNAEINAIKSLTPDIKMKILMLKKSIKDVEKSECVGICTKDECFVFLGDTTLKFTKNPRYLYESLHLVYTVDKSLFMVLNGSNIIFISAEGRRIPVREFVFAGEEDITLTTRRKFILHGGNNIRCYISEVRDE